MIGVEVFAGLASGKKAPCDAEAGMTIDSIIQDKYSRICYFKFYRRCVDVTSAMDSTGPSSP